MVSFTFKAVVAFLALAQVAVADYSITQPVDGTIWQEGQKVFITWVKLNSTTTAAAEVTTTIQLLEGAATSLQLKATIDVNVDPDSLNYTWTIPTTLTPNSDYALSIGNPPNVFYSHYFGIAAVGETTVPLASSTAAASSASSIAYTPPSNVLSSTSAPVTSAVSTAAPISTAGTAGIVSSVGSGIVVTASSSPVTTAKSGAEVLHVRAGILALVPALIAMYFL